MDPVSQAAANAAFATIKNAIGRDVESMMSDIGRWMIALSDLIKQKERQRTRPFLRSSLRASLLNRRPWRSSAKRRAQLKEMS